MMTPTVGYTSQRLNPANFFSRRPFVKESRQSSQISRIRKLQFTTKVASYPSASHVTFILTLPLLSEWATEKGMVRIFALACILPAQHNL